MNALQTRLLASYVAVILITLTLIGITLLLFLWTSPLPTDDLVNNLAATLLELRVVEVAHDRGANPLEASILTYLETETDGQNLRVMVVRSSGEVMFDSAGDFSFGRVAEPIDVSSIPAPGRARLTTVTTGRFRNPDDTEWVYVALPIRPLTQQGINLVVAQPAPRTTLREVFRLFGANFLLPLLRAGVIGILVAFVLSFLVSRSVARPLRQISHAAHQIADGDFNQRVPVEGPQEVRTLASSFNEMVDRVAVTQAAQRDFLANVSHDLRTPLTSIQGFSQAILDGVTSDPATAQHAAQIINDEAARMHRMVEELLELARLEAGRVNLRRHAVRPSDLLRGVADSISVKAHEKSVQLHVQLPPDLPRISGDADRLAQVFLNLLDNAIRHTPSGGQVGLLAAAQPQWIVVQVRDTGEGIPAADLPRIFERFYQVDKSRQRDRGGSMGLGLAITKQIVEAHNGRIQADSVMGQGTTFTIWLPMPAPDMSTVSARRI